MLTRLERFAAAPRAPLWLGLVAFALCLPAVSFGLQADDHIFPLMLEWQARPWAMFELSDRMISDARVGGALVWWSSPRFGGGFLRPLASLSHALEFTYWPEWPWLMHLINSGLYGACVALAVALYRRLASAAVAPLAGLLFAVDESHAVSAGWIAGRNTLLAVVFSLAALLVHLRARERPSLAPRLLRLALVALALGSGEAGTWAVALLFSHVLIWEPGSWRARLSTILPELALGVGWAAFYAVQRYGFRGTSLYRELSAPGEALMQGLLDLPVWLASLFGPLSGFFELVYPEQVTRLLALPIALLVLALLWPALRRSRECRFFALASFACTVPLLLTLPNSRVLVGPSFGGAGWIAAAIVGGRAEQAARTARWGGRALLAVHLWLALLLFPAALGAVDVFERGRELLTARVQPGSDVVLLQSPNELLSNYTLVSLWHGPEQARPRSLHQLYAGASALSVTRVAADVLEITAAHGWGYAPIERLFGARADLPRVGSEVRLPTMTARVLAGTEDGRPLRVQFAFPSPLESAGRQWLVWQGTRPVPFRPPAIGATEQLAPLPRFNWAAR